MKVLLTGLGSIGQRHARNLRTLLGPKAELLAYRVRGYHHVITPDLRIEPGADLEEQLGVRLFSDLDEALAQRPAAVLVTNPNSLHLDVALRAARAGCHLFIEKPIAHTPDGVDDLIRLVDQAGVVCYVAYQWRFHPVFLAAQAWLAAGRIGRVLTARFDFGEYLPGWHPYEDYREMPVSRRALGGGVVLAQIHDLDLVYALFGLPRRIFALGGHWSDLEIDVEDTASILLDHLVDGRPVPVHVHQDCVRPVAGRTCEVIGEGGRIRLDLLAQSAELSDRSGACTERLACGGRDRNEMFLDELRHFLACVRGEARSRVTAREGLDSLRMASAALESMATGRAVEVS